MPQNEKKRVPAVRFKGFSEDWEQRKLGELGTFKNGMNFDKNAMGHGYPFVNLQDIFGKNIVDNTNLGLAESNEKQRKDYSLKEGDVLFIRSSVKPEGVGEAALVPEDFIDTTYSGFLIRFRPDKVMNNQFKRFIFSSNSIRNQMLSLSTRSANTNINQKLLERININLPLFDEQKEIGNFFQVIENTIALHQRKLDKLVLMKKGFLQTLFPTQGKSVPLLRFTNFHSNWEQRKIIDMSKKTYGGGTPKTSIKEYWSGNFPWIQSSDLKADELNNVIPSKYITDEAIKNSATKTVPRNSIAIVTRVGVGKLAFMPYSYTTSQDFLSLSFLKVDSQFGVYSLYKLLQKELHNIQGTSIKGMTKKDLLEKKITLPTCNDEQKKIGKFFKQFDATIAFHQIRLNKLNEVKKAYLQKMFI